MVKNGFFKSFILDEYGTKYTGEVKMPWTNTMAFRIHGRGPLL